MVGGLRAFPDLGWETMALAEVEDTRRRHEMLKRQVTPDLAQRTADLSFAYPQVTGGVVTGMAQAGIEPFTAQAELIRTRSQELADAGFTFTPPRQGFWDVGLGRQIKGFTRGAFTIFSGLYDEVVKGGSAFIYGIGQGKSIGEAAESSFGYSPAAIAGASLLQGRPVNLGSGWFAGGDLSADTQAALEAGVPYDQAIQNQAQYEMGLPAVEQSLAYQQEGFQKLSGTEDIVDPNTGIRGLTLTPGRFVAAGVTEPGTWSFNQLSGFTDFASNVFLDPTNILGGAVADVRHLNRSLVGGSARPTVLQRHVDDWLASGHGDRTAQFIADTSDYRTLHGLFRKNAVESQVDSGFIYALTQTTDKNRVKELLSAAVQGGSKAGQLREIPVAQSLAGRALGTSGIGGVFARGIGASGGAVDVAGLRHAVKANRQTTSWMGRMSAEVGAGILRFDDISTAVDDLGQWLQAAGVDPGTISKHMEQLASVPQGHVSTQARMWGAFKGAAHTVAQKMIDDGLDAEVANQMVRSFNTMDDYRKFWLNDAGNPQMFTGSRYSITVNGQLQPIPTAQLLSEFMDWGIPLPDMRKIRDGLRRAAWSRAGFEDLANKKLENVRQPGQILPRFALKELEGWNDLGPGVMTQLVDGLVQRIWKPLVLLRIAWPVRVVAEEQVRMGAIGLDSAVSHPLHWLSIAMGRKLGDDVAGNPFEESSLYLRAQSRKGAEFGSGASMRSPYSSEYVKVNQGDARYWDGEAIQLQQLADDPLAVRIAQALYQADESASVEDILRPIKDEFSTAGTPLGELRDALAADASNWDVVNIRELADAIIDDRYSRLVHHAGGEVIMANHIDGTWTDLYGNAVIYDDIAGSYRNAKTGRIYTNVPVSTPRGELKAPLQPQMAPVQSSVQTLMERLDNIRYNDPDPARAILTEDPDELREWGEALDEMEDMFGRIGNEAVRDDIDYRMGVLGHPGAVADFISRNFRDILDNDPQTLNQLANQMDSMRTLIDEAMLKGELPPSGRASLRAAEMIEIAGDASLLRSRYAGYVPLPGQPTLDEIAGKTRWTTDEVRAMIGNSIKMPLHRYQVRPVPASFDDAAKTGTHIWSEPLMPGRQGNYGENVYIAHDGVITGELTIMRNPQTGEVVDVGMLRTAHADGRTVWYDADGNFHRGDPDPAYTGTQLPGSATDAADLLRHALGNEADTAAIHNLAVGGVSLRDWFATAGVDDMSGFTLNDMAEFMRAQYGAAWAGEAGPLGQLPSIALSNDGAKMMAVMLMRESRSGTGAASWPQAGMMSHATRAPRSELVEAIATGRLGDQAISLTGMLDDTDKVTRISALGDVLRSQYGDQIGDFPQWSKVAAPEDTKKLDRVVDHLFNILGSKPTNYLARSPAFKQFYYNRIGEMLPYVDSVATRDQLLAAARDAGVKRADLRAWVKKADGVTGELSADDIDEIAKAFALQETKRLLYDLTKKTQFFDITRNIFPFGEAWYEIITTWGRIINENPKIIRRMQQVIEGARQEGIFYSDPATGEEVFAMPHMNALSHLMGVSSPDGIAQPEFTGRVDGVNLVLNGFLPGVGPVVQVPAASLARDLFEKPEMAWARDLVFPFGMPEADGPGAIVDSLMPAWFKKALTAMGRPQGDDARLYNNTVIDVLRAMELNGEITPQSNPTEVIAEAQSRARSIYLIRSAQQFIGPTGAQVRWDVKVDPSGTAFAYQVLASEYREMIEARDGDRVQAFQDFVNLFGFDPAAIATAKTEQVRPRAVTRQGLDFQRANPELFEQYDLTAYYVAPDPPGGEFDYSAYLAQLRSGDRVGLTPDQWVVERNRLLGSIAYEKVRRATVELGIRNEPTVEAYLRTFRYNLMEQYPGYGFDNVGAVTQPEQRQFMAEFETWRGNPQLMETNAGQGLGLYLAHRDRVLLLAEAEWGISEEGFATAKSTAPLREYLLNAGTQLTTEYPDFGVIFQRHYLWEVEEPEAVAPSELLGVDVTKPDEDEVDGAQP